MIQQYLHTHTHMIYINVYNMPCIVFVREHTATHTHTPMILLGILLCHYISYSLRNYYRCKISGNEGDRHRDREKLSERKKEQNYVGKRKCITIIVVRWKRRQFTEKVEQMSRSRISNTDILCLQKGWGFIWFYNVYWCILCKCRVPSAYIKNVSPRNN